MTSHWTLINEGTASADIDVELKISETKTETALLTEDIGVLRSQVAFLQEDTEQLHQDSHSADWNNRTNERGKAGISELLQIVSDMGFAWRDVARLTGVSVPAVQKWRKGEGVTGDNRRKVASLIAACDLVEELYEVTDAASWFEMPLVAGIPITPMDLWTEERPDLIFDYASGHLDHEQVLTSFDPTWREKYRSSFEVFRASDGSLSLRSKED